MSSARERVVSNQKRPLRVLPLSEARARLSPLLRSLGSAGEVAIAVHGSVRGYLVAARRFEELRARANLSRVSPGSRRRVRGTLKVTGDLAAGSRDAAERLRRSARGART